MMESKLVQEGESQTSEEIVFFSIVFTSFHKLSMTGLLQDSLIRLEVPFQKLYTPEELKLWKIMPTQHWTNLGTSIAENEHVKQ